MLFLYSIAISIFELGTRLASLFDNKARLWIKGRDSWKQIEKPIGQKVIWIHCASVGEFEQARPLIEKMKNDYNVLLTFFSPSGFQSAKARELADEVCYLPTDHRSVAKTFIAKFEPSAVLFVKYEFWYNFMQEIHSQNIPFALISAYFPQDYSLLKWPGNLLGRRLNQFNRIFVQDEESKERLEKCLQIEGAEVSGDSRVDRVVQNKDSKLDLEPIREFVGNEQVLVIGSNWPSDDEAILTNIDERQDLKIIVAPHELGDGQWKTWKKKFASDIIDYDQLLEGERRSRVLYINRIGLLSSLYQFATVAYVGGGFGAAVHNTLEAAVWAIPVVCGPKNERFLEIQKLKSLGVIHEVTNKSELTRTIFRLLDSPEEQKSSGNRAEEYFKQNAGATEQILDWVSLVAK